MLKGKYVCSPEQQSAESKKAMAQILTNFEVTAMISDLSNFRPTQ